MRTDMQHVGTFPLDYTIRIYLPEQVDSAVVERTRGWLAKWFNGAVTYRAVVTFDQSRPADTMRQVVVIESHADDARLQAHGDGLQAYVDDLRRQLGEDTVGLMVGSIAPPVPPVRQLYSTEEAADYLHLSVASVKHHVYKVHDLHPVRHDPALLFAQDELDRFKETPRRKAGRPKQ